MFKAIEKETGAEVVVLSRRWADRADELRAVAHEDGLICQGCREPVWVRAGKVRRWHFAHKVAKDCRLDRESPLVLQARAALYGRLIAVFGEDAVTLEKRVDNPHSPLPRPVDCWVEAQGEKAAFWVSAAQAGLELRMNLEFALPAAGATGVRYLFTDSMLVRDQECPGGDRIRLTKTEREMTTRSAFDAPYDLLIPAPDMSGFGRDKSESLHYIDGDAEVLTTVRALKLVHAPQWYRGRFFSSPLSEVGIGPDGDFEHPGERELLLRHEEEVRAKTEQMARAREEMAALRQQRPALDVRSGGIPSNGTRRWAPSWTPPASAPAPPPPPPSRDGPPYGGGSPDIQRILSNNGVKIAGTAGVCMRCGEIAWEWTEFYPDTRGGKCRRCATR